MAMNTDADGKQHLRELLAQKQTGVAPPIPDSAGVRNWPPNPAMIGQPRPGSYPPPRGWNPMDNAPPVRGQCKLIHTMFICFQMKSRILQWFLSLW